MVNHTKAQAFDETAPRKLCILGSTGSVGRNTIDLIKHDPNAYAIEALTANNNVQLLANQAITVKAKLAVVADESKYGELQNALKGTDIECAAGAEAIIEAADRPADWVMAAIVGAAGLKPTLTAARRGAVIALANKECLVCAGSLMLAEVERSGATLLPVDSEHSAIFQIFDFDQRDCVERIILTASGGPFREMPFADMKDVTPNQATDHPNWDMGAKISVDSATMMNKGLELIEAYYLFDVPENFLEVLVHPQSIVHSMVAYIDGSVLAQLGTPDMRTPIAYALGWPRRIEAPSMRLKLAEIGQLTFQKPDFKRFPSLMLARRALQAGDRGPTILNAANELAVKNFLKGRIGFLDIARIVGETLERVPNAPLVGLDDVFAADIEAREVASKLISLSAVNA